MTALWGGVAIERSTQAATTCPLIPSDRCRTALRQWTTPQQGLLWVEPGLSMLMEKTLTATDASTSAYDESKSLKESRSNDSNQSGADGRAVRASESNRPVALPGSISADDPMQTPG